MRIGLDILYEKPEQSTGTITYLQGFLNALEAICDGKHQLFLFANRQSIEFCRKYAPNYRVLVFPCTGKGRAIRTILQFLLIPLYSRFLKLDVVNFLGTTGAFGTACARVQHVKTLHHYLHPKSLDNQKVQYLKLMLRPSIQHADVVIANSEFTKNNIVDWTGVRPDKIVTINEAVDHSVFYSAKEKKNGYRRLKKYGVTKPYILFVSTLWRYKNIEALIKAFSCAGIEHDLVVIGTAPNNKYKNHLLRLTAANGVRDRVKMVGHIQDRSIVRDFYTGADLYVSPSLAETFGLTILESMACGTPVIASRSTSIPEVAGDAAILFNPYDYKEIAKCIQQVLYDPELKHHLIQRGYQRAQGYSWEKTAKATLKAYELSFYCRRLRSLRRL